jgi:preprotein translocase subunit SecF
MGLATFGNDLYSGRRSIDFIGRRRLWYAIGAGLTLLSILFVLIFGLNPGIEFKGGSEFQLSRVQDTSESIGQKVIASAVADAEAPRISKVGDQGVRVQTERLDDEETAQVKDELAKAYGVSPDDVTSSYVGPTWGSDVSGKAVQGLVVFLLLVTIVIAAYFRTWKMAASALIALIHDLIITVGIYALVGFEVTPASVIGFLTILGYSLYDTVVVFDKVRENTEHVTTSTRRTFAEAANLAVNQTLVRSINTSVVALLPVASILFIGAFLLGAGTLKDISLALFVGIAAGTYSSIFIATPLLVDLRRNEPDIKAHSDRLLKRRAEAAAKGRPLEGGPRPAVLDADDEDDVPDGVPAGAAPAFGTPTGGPGRAAGQRQQPRRTGKSRPGGRKR